LLIANAVELFTAGQPAWSNLNAKMLSVRNRLKVSNPGEGAAAGTWQELFEPHLVVDVTRAAGGGKGRAPLFALVTMAADETVKALNGTRFHGLLIRREMAGNAGSGGVS
jgi:hypothetical protein